MWRSLVAHLTGGQGVAGSNPVIPTVFSQVRGSLRFGGAAFLVSWVPKWVPKYALDEHGRRYATGGRCPTSGPDGMDGPYCSPGGGASGLITQRSQVQILPPLPVKSQVRGPFSLRGGRASGVRDRTVTADAATGCGWMWVDSGVLGGHLRRGGAEYLSRLSTPRRRWPRRRPRPVR